MTNLTVDSAWVEMRRGALRCLSDGRKVASDEDAARFVDERGFASLMRLAGSTLPSLSEADFRDTWEGFDITDGAWRWKETLPQERLCAYGKFLRQRGFFISWRLFPAFYQLCRWSGVTPSVRDEGDQVSAPAASEYAAGLLGRDEYTVLGAVSELGPIDSRRLWRELKAAFGGNRTRFEQALVALQGSFRVMVCGGDLEGWSLHRWDLVERQVPAGLLAALPQDAVAREALLTHYVDNTAVCTIREAAGFFRWSLLDTRSAALRLIQSGAIRETTVGGWKGTWLSTSA
jgi:hypothetical protein